jgi:hypothetical protein
MAHDFFFHGEPRFDDEQPERAPARGVPGKVSLTSRLPPRAPRLEQVAGAASQEVPHKSRMEQAFGADLGGVHTVLGGPSAERALDARNANAATIGSTIVFARPDPGPDLVAHELAHTVQQGAVSAPRRSGSGAAPQAENEAENEAHAAGQQVAAGNPVSVAARAPAGVPQFDLRGTAQGAGNMAREQHEARGIDTPAGGSGGQHGSFVDHGEDDEGPQIVHDHGFLDDGNHNIDESRREDPTWQDHVQRLRWIAMLEGAELLRPDLVDGTSAYRHFLFGNGATREIEYGRFLDGDSSGQTVLESAMEDTRQAAIERHDQDIAGAEPSPGTHTYRVRTDAISVTEGDARYPYPATENWQKAIGAHTIWIEAEVTVEVVEIRDPSAEAPAGTPEDSDSSSAGHPATYMRNFEIDMTIHFEDMYNFNPGAADIVTGTPDAANGRFEITGLGHEYLNQGSYQRSFTFETTMDPADSVASEGGAVEPGRAPRTGRPDDRRAYPHTR